MRGWLADIAPRRAVERQVAGYHRLERMLELYCTTPLLPFEARAAEQCQRLWEARIRIGTMDLQSAAIALANDVILLSRNLIDFSKVPAFRVEAECADGPRMRPLSC